MDSQYNSRQKNSSMMPVIIAVIVLAVGGASFFGGMQFQKSKQTSAVAGADTTGTNASGFGNGNMPNGQRGGMGTFGEVTAVSSTSITVTDQMSSSSKTYTIASSTSITEDDATASVSDISTGDTVMVQTSSSDSSESSDSSSSSSSSSSSVATKIIINPSMSQP